MARVCAGQMHSGTHTERSRFARGTGAVRAQSGVPAGYRDTHAPTRREVSGSANTLDCMSKEPDVYASEVFDGRIAKQGRRSDDADATMAAPRP